MTRLRFLLDEHVDWAIQRGLLRLAPELDVLAVGQPSAPPKGTPDSDILRWIERLVTPSSLKTGARLPSI